ncbi:hypothetical protein J3E68DRAFT_390257 [Trichoderma sp. SZMC 28012]
MAKSSGFGRMRMAGLGWRLIRFLSAARLGNQHSNQLPWISWKCFDSLQLCADEVAGQVTQISSRRVSKLSVRYGS